MTADEFLFLPSDGGVNDLAIHPGGAELVWRNFEFGAVRLRSARTRRRPLPAARCRISEACTLTPPATTSGSSPPTSGWVWSGWSDGTGRPAYRTWRLRFPSPSPDGRWLATLDRACGPVIVYDFASGREWAALPPQAAEMWALSWSPDGTRLAAGLTDGGVVVWDLEQVRARLAEFGIELPSTAARTVVSRPPLLPAADFEKIMKLHWEDSRLRELADAEEQKPGGAVGSAEDFRNLVAELEAKVKNTEPPEA